MEIGIYEQLITNKVKEQLSKVDKKRFYVAQDKTLDIHEAAYYLGNHLNKAIAKALKLIKAQKSESIVAKQIAIANELLEFLSIQVERYEFNDDLIDAQGKILQGVLDQIQSAHTDIKLHLKEITPVSRLTQSELFTGGNVGLSLYSELKKEIRSSNRVDLLVSFIKWKAIVMLKEAFEEFTQHGGKLRVLTTTYMGATDAKAIEELSKLPNTEIKVSYNNSNERLHAKAYLFYRNTGYHTAYIGSSNFSRSALTDGLEWNIKVTTQEIPHIIDKFQKTFESYWNNKEFKPYTKQEKSLLVEALQSSTWQNRKTFRPAFFSLKPYHYQSEILEKLQVERSLKGSYRNLVVAATGTGKTILSAFDFKNFLKENPKAKFLFIAHRIEILQQAQQSFQQVLMDFNFGEIYAQNYQLSNKSVVFASIQTLNNLDLAAFCAPEYYDYIVIDEVHHAQAKSYQKIVQYFKPKILLGLTATPERMDGRSILPDFNERIAAEIRLPDALNAKLLCPFYYFGLSDTTDYKHISWSKGKYDVSELTHVYTADSFRVKNIIENLERYTKDHRDVCAVGFCASVEHAKFMAHEFHRHQLTASYLVAENTQERATTINDLRKKEINYLFVVDIFNEGIDLPEIDTILFLRPTESLTIFLQQLGRGLRIHEGKEVLTVLDFVGNVREEYDFENKFRALVGKTNTSIAKEVEQDFPNLPLGCGIILEKKAKAHILGNIRRATLIHKRDLVRRISNYPNHSEKPLTLKNFIAAYNLNLKQLYKNYCFSELKSESLGFKVNDEYIKNFKTLLSKKWLVTESFSYFSFIKQLIDKDFNLDLLENSREQQQYALMLFYDFYSGPTEHASLKDAIKDIASNAMLVQELREYIEVKLDQQSFQELPCLGLGFHFPLKIHARYTREQILVALELNRFEKKYISQSGTAENKSLQTEALFINLKKSEEDFSPTTMYEDYAISEDLFHWQSQNQTADTSPRGKSYINQKNLGKNILLFIRESKRDEMGLTQGYVFIGPATFLEYTGTKPMSITWKLKEELPEYIWSESAKLLGS